MQCSVKETKNNEDIEQKNHKENLSNNPINSMNELIYKEKLITSILEQRSKATLTIQRSLKSNN